MAHGHLNAIACCSMAGCTHHHQTHPHSNYIQGHPWFCTARQLLLHVVAIAYDCMLSHSKNASCYNVICEHCALICGRHVVIYSACLLPGGKQDHALTCYAVLCHAVLCLAVLAVLCHAVLLAQHCSVFLRIHLWLMIHTGAPHREPANAAKTQRAGQAGPDEDSHPIRV